MQRGGDGRMLREPDADPRIERAWNEAVDGPPGRELARLHPDDLAEQRDAGAQVRFGKADLRARRRQARLRLRHVGAGHLADVEAVAGLAQLLFEHLDVVALQFEDGGVAQHVHVGLRAVEQDGLLGVAQTLAGAEHLRLGLPRRVAGAETVEEGLIDLKPGAARRGARNLVAGLRPRYGRARDRYGRGRGRDPALADACVASADGDVAAAVRPGDFRGMHFAVLRARVGGPGHARPVARQGARHVLVRGADAGAGRVQGRIARIGARQRALDRLGRSVKGSRGGEKKDQSAQQDAATVGKASCHAHLPAGLSGLRPPYQAEQTLKTPPSRSRRTIAKREASAIGLTDRSTHSAPGGAKKRQSRSEGRTRIRTQTRARP